MTRIVLTGATGFLGRNILPVLQSAYGAQNVAGLSSRDYDLTDAAGVDRMFADHRPEAVVHFCGDCTGIAGHRARPAELYYNNTLMTALVFDAARRHGTRKIVYPVGSGPYAASAVSPIAESELWKGYPPAEIAPYTLARMMSLVAAQAYRQQYGLTTVPLIFGNVYGRYAAFDDGNSQVTQAMIRRFHEAKLQGADKTVMWGSGKPRRDFVYAGDIAALIPWFVDNYEAGDPVNVSMGTGTSLTELAGAVAAATGYAGRVEWDSSKPDGVMERVLDVSRLKGLGLSCPTPLAQGVAETAAWFAANYEAGGDGLRL